MASDPEAAAIFDKAMATFAPQTAAAVAAAYDFSKFRTIADVGGGNGALLIGILKANPRLRGIVFDQPHVVERARPHVACRRLGERSPSPAASFFEKVPAGADAYLLKHVIHDWNDADVERILKNCPRRTAGERQAAHRRGRLPGPGRPLARSRGAAANDVNMLVVTGGRQRSRAEFETLYAASGFRLAAGGADAWRPCA